MTAPANAKMKVENAQFDVLTAPANRGHGASPRRPTVILVTRPYIEPLLDGIASFVRTHRWNFITHMRRTGRFPRLEKPDAILATIADGEIAATLAEFSCPIVQMCGTGIGVSSPYPSVVTDSQALGELGAEHLLTLGRPHVAYYHRFDTPVCNSIRDGFGRVMQAAQRDVHPLDFIAEYPGAIAGGPQAQIPQAVWRERLREKLVALPRPCAVMAEDDRFAVELVNLVLDLGLRVPQDIAILGCGNLHSDLCISPVPLSSVDSNLEGVGYAAARLVQGLLDGEPAPSQPIVVPPHGVVPRKSTATFVCEDERIAAVVSRIRASFSNGLTVPELARSAGMSVRALQTAFKAAVGVTPRDEIHRCRMACAEQLLEETDLKVATIAAESGIGDVKSLARFFHLQHQTTPLAFRHRIRAGKRQELGRSW